MGIGVTELYAFVKNLLNGTREMVPFMHVLPQRGEKECKQILDSK